MDDAAPPHGTTRIVAAALLAALACTIALLAPTTATAAPTGPALSRSMATLTATTTCPAGLTHPNRQVVLLVHGTSGDGPSNFGQGLGKVLTRSKFDWCMLSMPDRQLGDMQNNAEYVVAAVRSISARTGRKVSVVGFSQGALLSRWALRWWPDVRAAVDRMITVEGANQGTDMGNIMCTPGRCAPSMWQLRPQSKVVAALNRVPMPAGPVYTAIGTTSDELIRPFLQGDRYFIPGNATGNILIQKICPGRVVTHVGALFDAVELTIVVKALSTRGHVAASDIPTSTCGQLFAPGIDPAAATHYLAKVYLDGFEGTLTSPSMVTAEPPLRAYAR